MSVVETVRALVEPILAEAGLELFDVEYGGGRVVVLADRPGGVDLDALTRATHRISSAFDREDPIPGGRYLLEVSSPGLERTLRTPAHFARYIGSVVSVKTVVGADGDRRLQGMLTSADETGFTVDGRRLSFADVERVRTVFEWGSPPRLGRAKRSKSKPADTTPTARPGWTSTDLAHEGATTTRPEAANSASHSPGNQKAPAS